MRGCGGAGHDRLFREQLHTAFISHGMQYCVMRSWHRKVRMISCISGGSVFQGVLIPGSD
jgi:hypothetical protein